MGHSERPRVDKMYNPMAYSATSQYAILCYSSPGQISRTTVASCCHDHSHLRVPTWKHFTAKGCSTSSHKGEEPIHLVSPTYVQHSAYSTVAVSATDPRPAHTMPCPSSSPPSSIKLNFEHIGFRHFERNENNAARKQRRKQK